MTRGRWSAEVTWDGVTRVADGISVSVDEVIELFAVRPRYAPRRFTFSATWPEAVEWMHAGRPAERAIARIYLDEVLVGEHPVQSITARRGGRVAVFEVADEPIRTTVTLPPKRSATVRRVDQDATQAVRDAREDAWAKYIQSGKNAAEVRARAEKVDIDRQAFDPSVYHRQREGMVFPVLVGQPGRGWDGTIDTATPAIPCIMWDAGVQELVVAGHHLSGPPNADGGGRVVIWTTTDVTSAGVYETRTDRDDNGRELTIARVSSSFYHGTLSWLPTPPHDPSVWSGERAFFAAMVGDTRGLPSHPCDVVPWLIGMTPGVRPAWSSFDAIREHLRGWDLDTAISAECSAWQALEGDVMPVLPMHLVATAKGIGAVRVNLEPSARDVVHDLVVGETIFVVDDPMRIERASGAMVNNWTLRFNWGAERARYRSQVSTGPTRDNDAAVSVARHGALDDVIETPWIGRRHVASRAVAHLLRKTALRRNVRTYAANVVVHGARGASPIQAGDIVRLTDPSIGVTRRLGVVSNLSRSGGGLRLGVAILSDV